MERKILFCDQAKTLMMLLVIVGHSMAFYQGTWFTALKPAEEAPLFGYGFAYLGSFHIFVFTFVSGYIFQYLKFEQGKYPFYKNFIKKKALRLLIPYAFLAAFWCVPFQIYFFHADGADLFRKFVLGYNPSQLWYILMLFFLFAIIYKVSNKIQSLKTFPAFIIAFAIYIFGMLLYALSIPFQLPATCLHMAFFLLGMVFRKNNVAFGAWYKFAAVHLILFCITQYLSQDSTIIIKIVRYCIMPFVNMAGTLMIISLIKDFQSAEIWSTSIFKFFKENFFTMYLVHQQIIYCSISIFNGLVAPPVLVIINFVTALSISSVICVFFNSFKATRLLIGK